MPELMMGNVMILDSFGIHFDLKEVLKKYAHKKMGRRFGWRWLSKVDKQTAYLNAVLNERNHA